MSCSMPTQAVSSVAYVIPRLCPIKVRQAVYQHLSMTNSASVNVCPSVRSIRPFAYSCSRHDQAMAGPQGLATADLARQKEAVLAASW